jgi:cation transport ATPase
MTKVLFQKHITSSNRMPVVFLVISIIIANSFIIFSFDEDSRSYFSKLTTSVTSAIALVTALVMVYRYKKRQKQQPLQEQQQQPSNRLYTNNNMTMMHFSICIFLALWFAAQVIWSFHYDQSALPNIADALWFIGYGFFGYFLYSLYYNFFRKEFEPLIIVLVAIIVIIVLIYVIDLVLSTSRLLSTQKPDISVLVATLAYPVLDAILLVPAVLIFWVVRRKSSNSDIKKQQGQQKVEEKEDKKEEEQQQQHITTSSSSSSSIWILLLSISMMLFAIANSGFAVISAYDPEMVQKEGWRLDIVYNSGYLCLAAAMIGYNSFFSFISNKNYYAKTY